MTRLTGARVLVAGAGAIGSAISLTLAKAGARVVLADPAPPGDNASGVAAGMLAPAFEAVLDPASAGHFPILVAARDAWTPFAEAAGVTLDRAGALWAEAARTDEIAARLDAVGAGHRLLSAAEIQAVHPGIAATAGGVFSGEDWRLEPADALAALHRAFVDAGGEMVPSGLERLSPGQALLADGRTVAVDHVVLACGFGGFEFAPELASLAPIKGQIVRLDGRGPGRGPVVRTSGGYLAPSPGGLLAGATMQTGVNDRAAEPEVVARLTGLATSLFPDLAGAPTAARAGVRAATPDGLPLVGFSREPGVVLATGARRNGWLLAPLVADMVGAYLAGQEAGPYAATFATSRFSS